MQRFRSIAAITLRVGALGLIGGCASPVPAPRASRMHNALPGIQAPLPADARRVEGVRGIDSEAAEYRGAGYRVHFDYGTNGGLPDPGGAPIREVTPGGRRFDLVAAATGETDWPFAFALRQAAGRSAPTGTALWLTVTGYCRDVSVCTSLATEMATGLRLAPDR